jgi:hypothetical protein
MCQVLLFVGFPLYLTAESSEHPDRERGLAIIILGALSESVHILLRI